MKWKYKNWSFANEKKTLRQCYQCERKCDHKCQEIRSMKRTSEIEIRLSNCWTHKMKAPQGISRVSKDVISRNVETKGGIQPLMATALQTLRGFHGIWGFYGGEDSYCGIVGYHTVQSVRRAPTIRRNEDLAIYFYKTSTQMTYHW
jgi:hypothetical protein